MLYALFLEKIQAGGISVICFVLRKNTDREYYCYILCSLKKYGQKV